MSLSKVNRERYPALRTEIAAMEYSGKLIAKGKKIAIVISRFNEFITGKLLDGAQDCLYRHEVSPEDIDIFWTPGSFEIPGVVQKVVKMSKYDAVICLGAILRGDTSHNLHVSAEVAKGIGQLSIQSDIPIGYGIINAETLEQAIERAGTKGGNRGWDTAMSTIEMVSLHGQIS